MASRSAFNSERLTYRAVEDNDEDLDFLHSITLDEEGFVNSNNLILRPQNKESTKKWKQYLGTHLIAVIICLTPSNADTVAGAGAAGSDEAQTKKKADPTPIGIVSLTGLNPRATQHRNANIGIDILPDYQRKGYGTEAINWITKWGFQTYGLHRIGIESFSHNEGAGRLYEKLGFVPEQRLREALWYQGGWSDQLGFAMLEDEWRQRQGQK